MKYQVLEYYDNSTVWDIKKLHSSYVTITLQNYAILW